MHSFSNSLVCLFVCFDRYGTHYSNIGAVLYYLVRLEPYTSYALTVQGGKFDHADRLFHSVAETWRNCLNDFTDVKELTPEWFYLPDFLVNCNGLELGTKQNGVDLGNVILPLWAKSPEDFVLKNLVVSCAMSLYSSKLVVVIAAQQSTSFVMVCVCLGIGE